MVLIPGGISVCVDGQKSALAPHKHRQREQAARAEGAFHSEREQLLLEGTLS